MYIALSHCWGTSPQLRTLTSNITSFERAIPWASFPETFKHAAITTKKLRISYLWIDSLCIVQDSPEDWKEQSALMGQVYQNSYLCLSALDSRDSTEGLLRTRDSRVQRPFRLWESPPATLKMHGPVFLFPTLNKDMDPAGPLAERAWVLQEELLSPRRVIFGRDMVYWDCISARASEAQPHGIFHQSPLLGISEVDWARLYKGGIGGLLDLSGGDSINSSKDVALFYKSWLLIVQAYSERKITKGSDRLAALAGIAVEFQKATGDAYHAGLWERYMWRELLWYVPSSGSPTFDGRVARKNLEASKPVVGFQAPTWSWASVDARIRYFTSFRPENISDH
ncbi:heterokaryon incompatibility protein-domain-containing protein, partial [Cercophora newfieldiana]